MGPPSSIVACHCKDCRKHTGAPVAVFVDYPKSQVRFLGAHLDIYESSNGVHRGFCKTCGSTMTYQGNNLPDMLHIHLGVFDHPDRFKPTEDENIQSKLPWACILGS